MKTLKALSMALVLHATLATSSAQWPMLITPTNTTWRYFTNGTDPGIDWSALTFDDNAWPQGKGLFGNEPNYPYPIITFIPGLTPITVYYRTHFTWSGGVFGVTFRGTNYVDDGSIIYLNGVEIARFNMPAGPAAFHTLAPVANPGGYPNLNAGEPVLVQLLIPLDSLTNGNANPLVNGDNVFAVEVHQNSVTSSDRVFGLSLSAGQCLAPCSDGIQPTNRTVLERRSTTFILSQPANCGIPVPMLQWYRNIGAGEELIPGATASSFTLTNAQFFDQGVYYCRMTTLCGAVDSRQATLTVLSDLEPPRFLSALVVGPGLHTFRLITDEELCGDQRPPPEGCGTDFKFGFNWQILQSDNPSLDLLVVDVTQINPTTYEFTTVEARDPVKQYQITVTPEFGEIGDRFGSRVPPGTFAGTYPTLTFVQGVAGYTGTQDAEIHSGASADTPLGALSFMKADLDDAGTAQCLLRFDSLFGFGTNRIPFGSSIIKATLTLHQIDSGTQVNLHRMLIDWNQSTVSWNELSDGVSANDVEARLIHDATKPAATTNGPIDLDVTTSVQTWLDGQPNYGWGLLPTGADGWTVNTSESGAATAPMLTVVYKSHIEVCEPAILVQPPATIVASELQTVIIAVGVTNTFMPVFQWTKNGVDIPGANQLTYIIQSVSPFDSGTYRLRISCADDPSRVVISSPTVLIVYDPPSRPYLIGAWAESDGVTVRLRFSEPVNPASALNLANYTFVPPLAVLSGSLSNASVTLTTAPRETPRNYLLRIANVTGITSGANPIDPNPTFVTLTSARVIVPWGANWLYSTNSQDATLAPPNTLWFAPNFAPGSDWQTGPGLFGYEISSSLIPNLPDHIATPLLPNDVPAEPDSRVTAYFRRVIDLPVLPDGASYVLCHLIDDGAIFYLDGLEIGRVNMTNPPPTFFTQRAAANIEASLKCFPFTATPGEHTLAAEVHQAGLTSSDVLFGVEVRAIGAIPRLEISESTGVVLVHRQADSSWELLSANRLDGPYNALPNAPLRTLRLPASGQTNHSFFKLRYTGWP